jgi:hypothetical protein
VWNDRSDSEPLMERLSAARAPEEARAILGQRCINGYASICHALTALFSGISLYLVVGIATGTKGLWVVGWLLPLLFLALFCGSISYGDIYWRIKGHRPRTPFFIRSLGRLNRNIQ